MTRKRSSSVQGSGGDLERLSDKAEDGFDLNDRDKVMATAVVAALLLFRNYQRPSAVMGATLEEYSKAKVVDGVLVIMHRCGHSKKTDVRYLYIVTLSTCVGKVTRDLP